MNCRHARLPCLSLSPGVCPRSCPLSQWCHPTVSSSVALFSFCLQAFPAPESLPAIHIRWPKYWSFSISPSNDYSELISVKINWFDLLALQGVLKSLLQHHSLKASILQRSAFCMVQVSHLYINYWKDFDYSLDYMDLCWQSDVFVF